MSGLQHPSTQASPWQRAGVLVLTGLAVLLLFRVVLLMLLAERGVGLHVDEAQYWWWSRDLQWGYFSKPPGIAALIGLSTALFGDSVTGIRVLPALCWMVAAWALWALGRAMHAPRAGGWAALLLCTSVASNWLGMVATTDALLMMFWALAMLLTWHAQSLSAGTSRWRRSTAWALAGAVLGLAVLGKYTAGALVASWAWLWWRGYRPQPSTPTRLSLQAPTLPDLLIAGMAAALVVSPHLLWNFLNDWPTLRHTAEITLQGGAAAPTDGSRTVGDRSRSLAEFFAGQWLLAGPALAAVLVFVLVGALARRQGPSPWADTRVRWALAFSLPLLLVGLAQALHAKAQVNWALPMLLGLCLAAGLWIDQGRMRTWLVLALGGITVALTAAISLHGDARLWRAPEAQAGAPDVWGRMRGWGDALAALQPALQGNPGLPVVGTDRSVIAQAIYAWRAEKRRFVSWSPDGTVRHHFDWKLPMPAAKDLTTPCTVLFVDNEVPAQFMPGATRTRIAQARSGRVDLSLWKVTAPTGDGSCVQGPR